MIMLTTILNFIVTLVIAVLGLKYLFGPVPAKYHAEMLQSWGIATDSPQTLLFKAINTIFGCMLLALSVGMATVTYFGILGSQLLWAKLVIVSMGLLAGLPMALVAYAMERETKVRTPWRPAAALVGVIILAFGLSLS